MADDACKSEVVESSQNTTLSGDLISVEASVQEADVQGASLNEKNLEQLKDPDLKIGFPVEEHQLTERKQTRFHGKASNSQQNELLVLLIIA